MAELGAALAAARSGRGGLVLIAGEPGIGKTALADAFATHAAGQGAVVAWGRAWEAGGAPAFWPWIEALRQLLDGVSAADFAAIGSSLALVAELLPEIGERFPELSAPARVDPAQARFRLFDAVATLLRWCARRSPVVLALDDLHAADPATLSLLHFAARGVQRTGVVLLGTLRDVEARMTPEVADEVAKVSREGRYLALPRLEREQIASWLDAIADDDAELAPLLYDTTEGNPLFMVETLRLWRARKGRPDAGRPAVPDSVRDVIAARLRSLSDETRSLLDAGSIMGRSIDLDLLATISGHSLDGVRSRLADAERADIVTSAGPHRSTFTHILLREVAYGELPAARRAELHAEVARALIARVEGDAVAPLAEIVHHLFAAIPHSGVEDAIIWARRAAERARDHLAFEDAVSFLERAVAAVPGDPARDGERCDLLLELARARITAGQGLRGREDARAAADRARRLGDGARLARAALAYGQLFVFGQIDPVLVRLLEEGLAALDPGDSELRARLLARLAAARQPAPDHALPIGIARDAIAMARRVADAPGKLDVLVSATSALLYFGEPEERIPLNTEIADLAGKLGDRVRELRGNLRLTFDFLELGDTARADASIDACARLANAIGHPAYLWYPPLLRAMRAIMRGQFADADELRAEARAIADLIDDPNRRVSFAMQKLALLRASGRTEALAEHAPEVGEALVRDLDSLFRLSCMSAIYARLGRTDDLRAALAQLPADLRVFRGRLMTAWLAEATEVAQNPAMSAILYECALPMERRIHACGVVTFACEEPMTRALGMLAAQCGRWDESAGHFEDALARVDALGAPPYRARIELDFASALLRRGRSEDVARARGLLESALAASERLGIPAIMDAATALLSESPPPAGRPASESGTAAAPARVAPAPSAFSFDLRSEGDTWAVTCEGKTFRIKDSRGMQILAELIENPDREFHVTDLMAPAGEAGHVEDAGEVLDDEAIASYRRRAEELKDELAEAESWNDQGRAARVREELEFLGAELSRAVGLGGRKRKASASAEKARINVRRRVSHAIEKLGEHSAELARHLEWAIKTGHFCVYHPTGRPR